MDNTKAFNHMLAAVGWGSLFIWWGIVVLVDPLTISMGAIGTGLIMLAVSAARWVKGIPDKSSTTTMGLISLAWGGLDQGRVALGLKDGASFALLLIVIGVVVFLGPLVVRSRSDDRQGTANRY